MERLLLTLSRYQAVSPRASTFQSRVPKFLPFVFEHSRRERVDDASQQSDFAFSAPRQRAAPARGCSKFVRRKIIFRSGKRKCTFSARRSNNPRLLDYSLEVDVMTTNSCAPENLLIVRSSLEVAALLKGLYPALETRIGELEREIKSAGQLLIDAGSVARARVALERIHRAQQGLETLRNHEFRLVA